MAEKDKLHTGELYLPGDPDIISYQTECLERLYDYNNTRPSEYAKREAMLKVMFAEIGEGCYIEPPFHSNFGGAHCHFGKNVYANFNLTLVDDTHIYVGDNTMFGPGVIVATAGHPLEPSLRLDVYQYNLPVHIGKNCWIGAFGDPCRVQRPIGEHDREYYFRDMKIPEDIRKKYGLCGKSE